MYENKTFLITGGTGSFGKTVVNDLSSKNCKEIRVFSRDEAKQDLMRTTFINDSRVKFYIGDIRDYNSIESAMTGVDYVFHAAALKQVPSCEFFPMQAVQTNIIGSDNVIRAAIKSDVERVVCLSTDKAVSPVNAMGISKSMMEKVALSYARQDQKTIISCVRYGNVMCSRGSVIPRFIEQIKESRDLTITNGDMTRFLMALPEAVELVEHAFFHANQGDIFVKKAPACTVNDLASALIELFKSDVSTKNIGTRHGEKLYETLASADELIRSEDLGDYYRIRMDGRDLNYEKYFTEGETSQSQIDEYHSHNTEQLNVEQVKELMVSLPEVTKELKTWGQ